MVNLYDLFTYSLNKSKNPFKKSFSRIEIEKKSKKGIKTVDIKQGIKSFEVTEKFDFAELDVVLSAGSSDNVNPNLLISAFENRF